MDLMFNELSVQPLAKDKTESFKRVFEFLETFKRSKDFGFNKVRFESFLETISLTSDFSLTDFCSDPKNRIYGTLLRGIARYPFFDEDSEEEKRYVGNSFKLQKGNHAVDCDGLAAAYLYSTIGISFYSEKFWDEIKYSLIIKGQEENIVSVYSVSKFEHFAEKTLIQWLDNLGEINLVKSLLSSAQKKALSIRGDHGKDVLIPFAEKLLKSPYVLEIVNSLPFNPTQKNFIRKVKVDGIIEIVLTKTDRGLGLVVKTTGRNLRETQKIAELLEKEFYC